MSISTPGRRPHRPPARTRPSKPSTRARRGAHSNRRHDLGGVDGNEVLTNLTASLLLILLAAEAITIVQIEGLVRVHMFIGLVLIPPVLLKLGTTGYRFVRYYGGASTYRQKGPPEPLARLTAPFLVLATVSLFGSGVAMMVIGHSSGGVLALHVTSFAVWATAFAIHLFNHGPRVARSLKADWRSMLHGALSGSGMRGFLLVAVLGGGVALALSLLGLITGWHGE